MPPKKQTEQNLTGCVFGNRWSVGRVLGEGACAKVYEASCVISANPVDYDLVVKVISCGNGKGKSGKDQLRLANTLNYEKDLYVGALQGFPYCPEVPFRFYGEDSALNVRYLVMQKLGCDLKELAQRDVMSPRQIALIGKQLITGMKYLHSKGYLFVDTKPANFMTSTANDLENIKFVDFGCCERYVAYSGSHRPLVQRGSPVGTPEFLSLDAHRGLEPSRKDDMESLALTLLSLVTGGKLPWGTATSDSQCKSAKESCDISELSSKLGVPELGTMIEICRRLKYDEVPPYETFLAKMDALAIRESASAGSGTVTQTSRSKRTRSPSCGRNRSDIAEDVSQTRTLDEDEIDNAFSPRGRMIGGARSAGDRIVADESEQLLHLHVLKGPLAGSTFGVLSSDESSALVTVGRGDGSEEDVDIALEADDFVSAVHFTLEAKAKKRRTTRGDTTDSASMNLSIRIRDAGSTNGTKLNGVYITKKRWIKVEAQENESFALIKVGKTTMVMPL